MPSTVATSAARGATAGTSTCRRAGVWAPSATGRRSARGRKQIGWRRDMRSPGRMEGCPNLLEPDRHAQSDRAGSQRQQGQEQREGEPEPVLIADLRGREDREERAVRRCEQLAQAASVLIREHRDLARQPEQVTVLAYQYGGGLCELYTPTNGALMAILAAAQVRYEDWLRLALPLLLALLALGAAAVGLGAALGLQ